MCKIVSVAFSLNKHHLKMKTFIVLLAIAALCSAQATLSEEQKKKLTNHHRECSPISGVNQELVTKARKGDFTDDPKLKEHIYCVSKKIGFQNEAGELQKDVLKAKLTTVIDADVADKLIAQCAVQKDTPQQTAYDTVKCYRENTPTHVSIV